MSSSAIHHDPDRRLFETVVDGHVAHLEYREDAGVLTILHTIVPPQIGGRGLGAGLVDAALAYASSLGLRIASECAFATHRIAALGTGENGGQDP